MVYGGLLMGGVFRWLSLWFCMPPIFKEVPGEMQSNGLRVIGYLYLQSFPGIFKSNQEHVDALCKVMQIQENSAARRDVVCASVLEIASRTEHAAASSFQQNE